MQEGGHDSGKACQLVAYHDSPVDCDGAGAGLGNGYQIQHLFLIDPVVLIHKGFFISVTIT